MKREPRTPEDAVLEELRAAQSRIGLSRRKVIKWLLRTTQQSPTQPRDKAALLQLRYELTTFAFIGPVNYGAQSLFRRQLKPWGLYSYRDLIFKNPDPIEALENCILPSKDAAEHLLILIKTTLEDFVDRGQTTLEAHSIRLMLFHESRSTAGLILDSDLAQNRVIVGLGFFLWRYGSSIRRCPTCHSLFGANRQDQQFCRSNCRTRFAKRKARGTLPERYERPGRPKKSRQPNHSEAKEGR